MELPDGYTARQSGRKATVACTELHNADLDSIPEKFADRLRRVLVKVCEDDRPLPSIYYVLEETFDYRRAPLKIHAIKSDHIRIYGTSQGWKGKSTLFSTAIDLNKKRNKARRGELDEARKGAKAVIDLIRSN